MKILITGICGFVGSTLARALQLESRVQEIIGLDNLRRAGSQVNLEPLRADGVQVEVADIRDAPFWERAPKVDWVIDAAAEPSVLAGVDGTTGSLDLVENNLYGTIQILEYCKRVQAGFILLSTSRVYSIPGQAAIEVQPVEGDFGSAFFPKPDFPFPPGISRSGISETYATTPPVSLYGSTKVASEQMALEYGLTFNFPVWINRCGVLAGAGQFGVATQGIFSFWIHSWLHRRPLRYIGFGGKGHQVRDCLHPFDLLPVLMQQMEKEAVEANPIYNLAGGIKESMSLEQLSGWCRRRFGDRRVTSDPEMRPFDLPWIVLDSQKAEAEFQFKPHLCLEDILVEIAEFAESHPEWMDLSQGKTR